MTCIGELPFHVVAIEPEKKKKKKKGMEHVTYGIGTY